MTISIDYAAAMHKLQERMNPKFWQARKEKGLSQTALGADAGIGQAEISMIENDGWIPPVAVRQRLATLDTLRP